VQNIFQIAVNVDDVEFVAVCPGLILYNGQYEGGGDFVSLGLVNGRVDFRLNVGSGPVSITSDEISLHSWHTLRFRKHKNTGKLFTICIYGT